MSHQEVLNTIKLTVHRFLPDAKVLLFGSRARGDYDKNSDFDVLVITKNTYPLKEKRQWRTQINNAIILAIHAPVDVLINSEDEVNAKKELPGHVIKWALKDAFLL